MWTVCLQKVGTYLNQLKLKMGCLMKEQSHMSWNMKLGEELGSTGNSSNIWTFGIDIILCFLDLKVNLYHSLASEAHHSLLQQAQGRQWWSDLQWTCPSRSSAHAPAFSLGTPTSNFSLNCIALESHMAYFLLCHKLTQSSHLELERKGLHDI